MKVQEAQIVQLQHAPTGELWHATGFANPKPVPDRSVFVRELSKRDNLHVRMLGTKNNAQLICELYKACCSPGINGKIEVASPAVCLTQQELTDPEITLYRMRQCLLSPSLGGWHQVDELDFPTYALAAQLSQDGDFTDNVLKILLTNKVCYDLEFIQNIDMKSVGRLMADILDPRWFIHLAHPYRLSKLRNYLGLFPKCMQQVLTNKLITPRHIRCANVLNAWKTKEPDDSDYFKPGNFLWRRWRHGGRSAAADLASSHAFLVYFIRNWQQCLVSKSPQRIDMFVPEYLLNEEEAAAYRLHAEKRDS